MNFNPQISNQPVVTSQNNAPNQGQGNNEPQTQINPITPPQLSLPNSGGAIKGIGEKFTMNPATGTGNFSVPIGVTAGRGAPQLSLSYSSGAGNSPFGIGWGIGIPRITRKIERELPKYYDAQESDTFILSGAEDLVPKLNFDDNTNIWKVDEFVEGDYQVKRYRPRTEGLFARIEKLTHTTSKDVYWRSISGENITSIYGETAASRVTNPNNPKQVFSWLLSKTFDNKGNITVYDYKQEDNVNVPNTLSEKRRRNNTQPQQYLKRILYSNQKHGVEGDYLFQVVFDYGEHDTNNPKVQEENTWSARPDAFSFYRSGFEIRTRRLCKRVLMFHDFPVEFGLGTEPRLIQSTNFEYNENSIATEIKTIQSIAYLWENNAYTQNALPPLEFKYSKAELDDRQQRIDEPNTRNTPQGLSGNYQFTDLNAEGLSGVLMETADAWYYRRNLGEGQFDGLKLVREKPNWSNLSGGTQISNLEANGAPYLVSYGNPSGYSERLIDGSWSPFRDFDKPLNIDFSNPDIRFIDLNGDGKPEILLLRDQLLRWYPNEGEKGFEGEERTYTGTDESKGPAQIFQNDLESIFLTDMTGDGLSDIVRIRNYEICYWANLGYGRFGEKVVMDNAPWFEHPDLFTPANIRLGDIDGSGTTDILYLGRNKTQYWFNQSGNGFSDGIEIKSFPSHHNHSTVSLTDLLGNGTACLVWSSPLEVDSANPWRFVDIMGSTKPYLLTEIRNNMGSVSRVHYKPSTYYYLQDEREGKPWVTKLPFPVHVVDKSEVEDLITGHRFVSQYAYHHGYYDRAEREFRGFGFVEQWDDETFKDPDKNNPNKAFEKPRIHTKSWFHVGAWEQADTIAQQFEQEYFNPAQLGDSEISTGKGKDLTTLEIRQAKRALRGQLLRQEVYTEDDSPDKDKPYVVTESRYQIKRIQPTQEGVKHSVFLSVPMESLSIQYERNIQDPRIAHQVTLEIDDFGNVLKSAAIAYPRLFGSATDLDHDATQYELKIIYTENAFFNQTDNQSDWYVKGIPISATTYEIIQQPLTYPPLFSTADLIRELPIASKKLLSAQVSYFRPNIEANTLTPSKLAFGEIESFVLPYGTYALVLTDDILQNAYGDKLTKSEWEDLLIKEKYERETHNNITGWWVTNGFAQYDESNFFITNKTKDVWGNISEVVFDSINLLPIKVIDPLKNTIQAKYDYRILQALEIIDPNSNRQQAAYDGFGRVIRTTIMGKDSENKGDVLSKNPTKSFSPSDSDTSVMEYHHERFWKEGKPNFVHSYTRETHHHDLAQGEESRWLEARVYSDGFGRELQSKAKIAPGKAYYVENGNLKSKDSNPRWLGSGRTIYDNKGQPVKQYEPYFSTTEEYEPEDELTLWGVTPFIHYDALGRVIRTDAPDGTFSKVEFTPWKQLTYDANDTVAESDWYQRMANSSDAKEQRAAALSLEHKDLPALVILDVLGRPVVTKQKFKTNKPEVGTKQIVKDVQESISKVVLDTVGNPLQTVDANGNIALEVVFDLAGRPLKSISNDAGTSYSFLAIDNQPVRAWLPRGHKTEMVYDNFRRPTELWVTQNSVRTIQEKTIYGEAFSSTPETANMRGQVWKSFDQAGIATVDTYDFKGAPLESTRQLFKNQTEKWTVGKINNPNTNDFENFSTTIIYDALGRPLSNIAPDGSITENSYDQGGQLQTVKVKLPNETTFIEKVKSIQYNEKGQREKITYGNNVQTTYKYDPLSYRLINLKTQANAHLSGKLLQDLYYTYDAAGNIVEIEDKSQKEVFFNNQRVPPSQKFEYDSLNRLIKATGREHIGQQQDGEQIQLLTAEGGSGQQYNFDSQNPAPTDLTALRNYTQSYAYDKVGNILRWKHQANGTGSYTRDYKYDYQTPANPSKYLYGNSNRLIETDRNTKTTTYDYDAAGNILQLDNHSSPIQWNFENQPTLMVFTENKGAFYSYDATGERVRKVVLTNTSSVKERIYLGNFEIYREKQNGTITKERTSLHVADDSGRICIIETVTKNTDRTAPTYEQAGKKTYRYQLSNHLGSVGMEVNQKGDIISFEEYHPYGTTAFSWKNTEISQKQYRYTGQERDEESGLSYHSARFYMPWLGRWLSADPAGMVDGACLYQYALGSPNSIIDKNGKEGTEVEAKKNTETYTRTSIEKKETVDEILVKNPFGRYSNDSFFKIAEEKIPYAHQYWEELIDKGVEGSLGTDDILIKKITKEVKQWKEITTKTTFSFNSNGNIIGSTTEETTIEMQLIKIIYQYDFAFADKEKEPSRKAINVLTNSSTGREVKRYIGSLDKRINELAKKSEKIRLENNESIVRAATLAMMEKEDYWYNIYPINYYKKKMIESNESLKILGLGRNISGGIGAAGYAGKSILPTLSSSIAKSNALFYGLTNLIGVFELINYYGWEGKYKKALEYNWFFANEKKYKNQLETFPKYGGKVNIPDYRNDFEY